MGRGNEELVSDILFAVKQELYQHLGTSLVRLVTEHMEQAISEAIAQNRADRPYREPRRYCILCHPGELYEVVTENLAEGARIVQHMPAEEYGQERTLLVFEKGPR